MDLKDKIISLIVSLVITGFVIYKTPGRISRSRYIKFELFMISAALVYITFAYLMLLILHTALFLGIGIIASFFFIYKYMQLQILRLHDLNYSGWYCLFSYIPLVNIYSILIRFLKERNNLINEFDESINYFNFMKKNDLYPKRSLIELNGMDFYVNKIKFEYVKYNGHIQYEVSIMSLEENKLLDAYCKSNLTRTETSPSYTKKFKISFLDDGNLLNKIKTDLNAVIIYDGYIKSESFAIFIRKNFGLYEIIYHKNFSPKIKVNSEIEFKGDYCCQTINRSQLKDFLSDIK